MLPAPLPDHKANSIRQLQNFIRKLHGQSQGGGAGAGAAVTVETCMWLGFLDRHAQTLLGASLKPVKGKFGNVAYRSEQLVKAMLMSCMLRDRAELRRALIAAASFFLDADTAREIKTSLQDTHSVPSAATLSRHQLCIAVAWMMRHRRWNNKLAAKRVFGSTH